MIQALIRRIALLIAYRRGGGGGALGGLLDSLVQSFENCRPGLPDDVVRRGGAEVERFFLERWEKELPRVVESLRLQAPYLTGERRPAFLAELDDLVRKVVVPGYARLAAAYTPRERNRFYLLGDGLHGLERVLWIAAGMAVGALAIWALFIPIWAKEWIAVFGVLGFFVPTLRRFLSVRGYEAELNDLVGRADRELGRLDMAHLTAGRTAEDDAPAEQRPGPLDERPARRRRGGIEREGG